MRIPKLFLLGLGGGVVAAVLHQRKRGVVKPLITMVPAAPAISDEPNVMPLDMQIDPDDPVQGLDDVQGFHIEELGVDALSAMDSEADQDLAMIESSLGEAALELDAPEDTTLDTIERSAHDVGDLYGVHTPHAEDRSHLDDDAAFASGQNWIEALETDAIEGGATPELPLDQIFDDADLEGVRASDTRDIPVADRGAGGPGGI